VFDTGTNTFIANLAIGNSPEGVSVTPDGSRVYVANSFSGSVSVIDAATNTVGGTITTGGAPFAFGNFIGGAPPVRRRRWARCRCRPCPITRSWRSRRSLSWSPRWPPAAGRRSAAFASARRPPQAPRFFEACA